MDTAGHGTAVRARRLGRHRSRHEGYPAAVRPDLGTIRGLDLIILTKGATGEIDVKEADAPDSVGELRAAEEELAGLLAEEDVVNPAAAMEPGTTAGVLVRENVWAAPFASAARRSGGRLIAPGGP